MFFGKGDSSKLTEEQTQILSNLRRMGETGHLIILTPDQSEVAIKAIDFYSQWESVARLGATIRNTGLLVTGLLATWWVAQEQIAGILGKLANGP